MCSETGDQTNTSESTPAPFSKVHVSYTISATGNDFQFLKIMTLHLWLLRGGGELRQYRTREEGIECIYYIQQSEMGTRSELGAGHRSFVHVGD